MNVTPAKYPPADLPRRGVQPDTLRSYAMLLRAEVPRWQLAKSLSRELWEHHKSFPLIMSHTARAATRYVPLQETNAAVAFLFPEQKLQRVEVRIHDLLLSDETLEKGRANLQKQLTKLFGSPTLDCETTSKGRKLSTWSHDKILCVLETGRERFYAKLRLRMELEPNGTLDDFLIY